MKSALLAFRRLEPSVCLLGGSANKILIYLFNEWLTEVTKHFEWRSSYYGEPRGWHTTTYA